MEATALSVRTYDRNAQSGRCDAVLGGMCGGTGGLVDGVGDVEAEVEEVEVEVGTETDGGADSGVVTTFAYKWAMASGSEESGRPA